MKRLAGGLANGAAWGLAAMLSGCIFLTPPTGLRVGDHSHEFDSVQQPATVDPSAVAYIAYDAPDFSAIYPKDWGEGKKNDDLSTPSTTRLSAGVRTQAGEAEGIVVTTINQVTNPEDPKANEALAVLVKGLLSQDAKTFELVSEKDDKLGGAPAVRLEAKSTDANGNVSHQVTYSLVFNKRAWVVVISTPDARYATLEPIFTTMATSFAFKNAAAPSAAPTTAPSGAPTGVAPDVPIATGSPTPTPSPTVTPSGAPNVPPPSPTGSQAPSPSPTP